MKLTKSKLKEIIREEIQRLNVDGRLSAIAKQKSMVRVIIAYPDRNGDFDNYQDFLDFAEGENYDIALKSKNKTAARKQLADELRKL